MSRHPVLGQLAKIGFDSKQLEQSAARSAVWSRNTAHFQIQPESTSLAQNVDDIHPDSGRRTRYGNPCNFRPGGSSLSGQTLGTRLVVDTHTGIQSSVDIQEDCVTRMQLQYWIHVRPVRLTSHLLNPTGIKLI
jgi:hypothetical protein